MQASLTCPSCGNEGMVRKGVSLITKALEKESRKVTPGSLKGGKSEPSSKAKPGAGGRFKALEKKLGKKKGVKDPGALAAALGRAKFGKKKFQSMAKKGSAHEQLKQLVLTIL